MDTISASFPIVNADVDDVLDTLRPLLADLLSQFRREYKRQTHTTQITLRPAIDPTARPGKDVAIELKLIQSSAPPGPHNAKTTRNEMIDELLAIADFGNLGSFGLDNLLPQLCGRRVYHGLHKHTVALMYSTMDALISEWLGGQHPDIPFELRILDGEPIPQWEPVSDKTPTAEFPPRAECDDERIKVLFGIYGPHRRGGVLENVQVGGKQVQTLRYECEEDLIAEWRKGSYPDIPFALRTAVNGPSSIYRVKDSHPPITHCIEVSDYPARRLGDTQVPECYNPGIRCLFASEVHNHIGKPWARRLGHRRTFNGRKSLLYKSEKTRWHDWLLGIYPDVAWADRLIVDDVPPKPARKRTREIENEDNGPPLKRARRDLESTPSRPNHSPPQVKVFPFSRLPRRDPPHRPTAQELRAQARKFELERKAMELATREILRATPARPGESGFFRVLDPNHYQRMLAKLTEEDAAKAAQQPEPGFRFPNSSLETRSIRFSADSPPSIVGTSPRRNVQFAPLPPGTTGTFRPRDTLPPRSSPGP
ncbi:hypothetical protein MIND_01323800 [Mycena indigotica]|uniref:Uncharacterized protein n=1 Tax=Mycena indigotica TaxID=2126181 RepID=A0A8H6S179_9AGAR|nr:uncharacterized protein MIND_01323800 [Mycena indigotica]KAF7290826.1 hypothetical protein MIND_01323800 [Mycena indigotica]